MSIKLSVPPKRELKPRIVVIGVGGAGGNAVNNMIAAGLEGVDFVVANTDAQALANSKAERRIQMGIESTQGLGAGSDPEIGREAAQEALPDIVDMLQGAHMVFVTAGMGGGTGTGAAPIIANAAREQTIKGARERGILTVGVVTKPFEFEGARRMRAADDGIAALEKEVDTLIVIPNQNLFSIANAQTTFAEAFAMADEVLHSGVASITDLMINAGLINLDFSDVYKVMHAMGKAMMGTGEAEGENRAREAAETAIANPLLDIQSMRGARGVLINITGGTDMTLHEVEEAANIIKNEVDDDANIIVGSTLDENLAGVLRVSVVAAGIGTAADANVYQQGDGNIIAMSSADDRLRNLPREETPPAASAKLEAETELDIPSPLPEASPTLTPTPAVPPAVQAPVAEAKPQPRGEAQTNELPDFLRERPTPSPRRELPKRSRSFVDRILGRHQEAKPASAPASTSMGAKPVAEKPVAPPPPPATSETSDDSADAVAPPMPAAAPQSAPQPAPQSAAAHVAASAPPRPAASAAQPPVTAAVAPEVEVKAEMPAPEVKVEVKTEVQAEVQAETPATPVAPPAASAPTQAASPPVQEASTQTRMETTPAVGQDLQQLDIPTFLRR